MKDNSPNSEEVNRMEKAVEMTKIIKHMPKNRKYLRYEVLLDKNHQPKAMIIPGIAIKA